MSTIKNRPSSPAMPDLPLGIKKEYFLGHVIRYDLMRFDKPLSEITAADVPPGFDPEDLCALNPDGSLMRTR
jgi:hypothetical protein